MKKAKRFALAAALTLFLFGGATMAEDSPEVAALKAEKAKVEAERDLARVQLEALKAQKELADTAAARQVSAQKSEAEAQTALFNQQKAAADAQSAALAAEAIALKAKFGTVTGSQITGTVTTEAGAGSAEANLLAAKAVDEAAALIAKALSPTPDNKKYIVFAGSQRPTLGHWRTFSIQSEVIQVSFNQADFVATQARRAAEGQITPAITTNSSGTESVANIVTGAGAVLDIASKLGSYFMTDYKASAVTLTGCDDDLLAVGVVGRLSGALFPARWASPPGANPVSNLLARLAKLRDSSIPTQREMQEKGDHYKAAAEKESDAKRKDQLKGIAGAFAKAGDAYVAAQKRFDDLLVSLATADKDGVPLVAYVIDEKPIAETLEGGAYALFVKLTAAGGYYTKKNLWTFLGSMPFYVSGGTIASYVLVDGGSGVVVKAGQFTVHSGYYKINDVADQFSR